MGSPSPLPADEVILGNINNAIIDLILSGKKPEAVDFNADKALAFLKEHAIMEMVEGYLVAYVVTTPWYAVRPVLTELLVLRISDGGRFTDVTKFFEERAKLHDCERIATGTLLAADDASLAALYQRQGYHSGAWQMCKEVG